MTQPTVTTPAPAPLDVDAAAKDLQLSSGAVGIVLVAFQRDGSIAVAMSKHESLPNLAIARVLAQAAEKLLPAEAVAQAPSK